MVAGTQTIARPDDWTLGKLTDDVMDFATRTAETHGEAQAIVEEALANPVLMAWYAMRHGYEQGIASGRDLLETVVMAAA